MIPISTVTLPRNRIVLAVTAVFLGHGPLVDFNDETNLELQRKAKAGAIVPGQTNPPGYFCSPHSVASYGDRATGENYIAVADQCNYRLVVSRWSDIGKALGQPITLTAVRPARPIEAASRVRPAARRRVPPRAVVTAPAKKKKYEASRGAESGKKQKEMQKEREKQKKRK